MTTIVGQCRVKALNTELAIPGLYQGCNEIHDQSESPDLLMRFITHNDIHGSFEEVTAQVRLEKGLGLQSTSATQAIPCRFGPHMDP